MTRKKKVRKAVITIKEWRDKIDVNIEFFPIGAMKPSNCAHLGMKGFRAVVDEIRRIKGEEGQA